MPEFFLVFEKDHEDQSNSLELDLNRIFRYHIRKYQQYQSCIHWIVYKRPSAFIRPSTSFIISGIVLSLIPLSSPFLTAAFKVEN